MKSIVFFFAALCAVSSVSAAERTLIHCGRLIDGRADTVREQVTVVVLANKIVSVDRGFTAPQAGDKVLDHKSRTVLPGLIDLHVHLQGYPGPERYLERFTLNPEDLAFRSVKFAKITLHAGFTTVRDLGGEQVVALRRAIEQGYVEGPRIIAAGRSIATTGGHADPSNSFRRDLQGDPGPDKGVINGPDDARKAVRQRYKEGSDVIKVTATGGVLSVAKDGFRPQVTQDELNALVQTARDLGLPTAAHAHGDEGMRRAVLAGITTIEHGTMMSEATMDLMKKHGTWYVPTLSAGRFTAEKAEVPGYYPPIVAIKAKAISPLMMATFTQAVNRGVKIAFGTDAGVFPHGDNAKEFLYMVEGGMKPMKAIQSATLEAARVLGMDAQLGTLEPGKLADVIAVDGNPAEDMKTLLDVPFVMKDGMVVKGGK
ncbi:MAG: amidohydrolase family protein [Verrucomicrobia bacterium]|nr:amidohydrolase family protein [Verrucomicrobiota bacterium]